MKVKTKALSGIIFLSFLFATCGCSGKKNIEEDKIMELISNYQYAINCGDFDTADSYCDLEDGEQGSWFFRESGLVVSSDDQNYIMACKMLTRELFLIEVKDLKIDGDTATASTRFSQCDLAQLVEGLPKNYDFEQLETYSVDECKDAFIEDAKKCMFSFEWTVRCKKINNVWKIVAFE